MWYGYTLYTETETGRKLARTRKEAYESWQSILDEYAYNAELSQYYESENNYLSVE